MDDQDAERNPPRDVQRALRFLHRARPPVPIRACQRERRAPAAADEALGDRRVDPVQIETRLRQPLLQVGDCGRIVIVEVRPRGEELDGLEAVSRRSRAADRGPAAGRGRGASTPRTVACATKSPTLAHVTAALRRVPRAARGAGRTAGTSRGSFSRSEAFVECTGCRPDCGAWSSDIRTCPAP